MRTLDEAIASRREVIRLEPEDPAAHTSLARELESHGKLNEAIESFRVVIRLKPDDASAYSSRARLAGALERQGRVDEAVATHREITLLKPNDAVISGKITAITPLKRCSVICAAEFAARRPQVANGAVNAAVVSTLDKIGSYSRSKFHSC